MSRGQEWPLLAALLLIAAALFFNIVAARECPSVYGLGERPYAQHEAGSDQQATQNSASLDHEPAPKLKGSANNQGCYSGPFGIPADGWVALFTLALTTATIGLWIVTYGALRHAERSSERELRAYVGVEDIYLESPHLLEADWDVPQDTPPDFVFTDLVRVKIRNAGKSPASHVAVFVGWHHVTPFGAGYPTGYSFPLELTEAQIEATSRFILDSGSAFVSAIVIRKSLKPFRDASKRVCSLYFDGRIEYTDIFDRKWERTFRFAWEPWRDAGDQLAPARDGNKEVCRA